MKHLLEDLLVVLIAVGVALFLAFLLLSCGSSGTAPFPCPKDASSDVREASAAPQDAGCDSTANPGPVVTFDLQDETPGQLTYKGGRILTGDVPVYLIWYGDWATAWGKRAILEGFVQDLPKSLWLSLENDLYEDGVDDAGTGWKSYVSGVVHLAASVEVGYPSGAYLTDETLRGVVASEVDAGVLPSDPGGIYVVLTSADVGDSFSNYDGFCNSYCGYHEHFRSVPDGGIYSGPDLKYAFVGDPSNCLDACTVQPTSLAYGAPNSPNGDWGVDSMANVLAHELAEAISDPDVDAWQDEWNYDMESEDKCAWRFDPAHLTDAGAYANLRVGDRDFLVQQGWRNTADGGGACLLP